MAKEFAKKHPGFAGGVFLFDSPAPDQAANISNMILDPDGRAYKRQGYAFQSRIPPLGVQILSLFVWYRVGASMQILAQGADGHLYYTTDLTNWTDGGSGLSVSLTASFAVGFSAGHQTTPPTYDVTALNAAAVYIADGSKLFRWDGTTLLALTGGPAAAPAMRYLCWWKDTLWGLTGKGNTNPEMLYSSAAGNADTWPALNFVAIGKGDGDYGTALFTASQEMIVSKQKRTFRVTSPSLFSNEVVDYEKGCESHWSVVKFDADIYYITRYGVVRFISGAPAEFASNNIQPLFSALFLNMGRLEQCHAYRVHHRVGWTLVRQGQTIADFQVEYYPQFPRLPWTFHRMPAKTFITVRDTNERLFFAKSDQTNASPGLYEAFQLAAKLDDGVDFSGMIETKWDDLGDPVNRKYLRAIRVWGDGKVYVQVKKDRREFAGQLLVADLIVPGDPKWNEGPNDKWNVTDDRWGSFGNFGTDIIYPDLYGRQFSILLYDKHDPTQPEVVLGRRDVADLIYHHPRGWSLLELTLEAVQMGELG